MTHLTLTISLPGYQKTWRFSGPSDFSELTDRQAVAAMRFRLLVSRKTEIIFPLLTGLYGIPARQLRWLFDVGFLRQKQCSEGQISHALQLGQALLDTLRWIGETEPGARFLVPQLTVYSFRYGTPAVLLNRRLHPQLYYPPAEGLAHSTFEEFMYAEKAYQAKQFALLAAILYRPAGPSAVGYQTLDKRCALDKHELEDRKQRFADLEPALMALIIAHYEACQRELQRCFPRVFPKKLTGEGQTGQASAKSGGNWLDVAINLAKLDVTKIQQIEQTNLYLALKVLDEQIRQADELERELEKVRKK